MLNTKEFSTPNQSLFTFSKLAIENTIMMYQTCSKLTKETTKRRH